MQLCVRAESILASYLLAKEAQSPKSGIVQNPLFFPNHTPSITLLKYRYPNPNPDLKTEEVPKVTSEVASENLWALNCAHRNYFYLEHRISHGCAKAARSADQQLVEIPGSSKALISLDYNPTLTLTLLNYPNPNLNLTLIQKLKLSVKLDSYSDFRGLNKFSMSCRVPNKCMTLARDTQIPLSTLSTHTMLNVRELTTIGNRWNLAIRLPNVVQNEGYGEWRLWHRPATGCIIYK